MDPYKVSQKNFAVGDNLGHRNVTSQKQKHTKNIWHVYTINNYCIKYVYKCKKNYWFVPEEPLISIYV